ncbi:MAG: transposase, partial [Candidatus Omnitrophica bacterium]|nr:transposase [Candidatus Omnitrophota bacterium]
MIHRTEHCRFGYLCPQCHRQLYALLPKELDPGDFFGPRLPSLVAYMRGALHGSYTSLNEFIGEIFGLEVSRSMLCNQIRTVSQSLGPPYQELKKAIAHEPSLHVDETSHKDKGETFWIWAFCTKLFGFFTIEASRGSQVLRKVLGETFTGTLISDFFSADVKYASALQQFYLAHRIRDIKFLTTLPDQT